MQLNFIKIKIVSVLLPMMFGGALILTVCCATLWSSGSAFKVPAIAADLRNNYAGKNLIFSIFFIQTKYISTNPEFSALIMQCMQKTNNKIKKQNSVNDEF